MIVFNNGAQFFCRRLALSKYPRNLTSFSPEVHYSTAHSSARLLQPYPILLNQSVYQESSYTWDRVYFEFFLSVALPWRTHHYNTFAGFASLCQIDRKSTRLNSSHVAISYDVFCLKQKNI